MKIFLRFFFFDIKYRIYNEKIIILIVLYFITFLSHSFRIPFASNDRARMVIFIYVCTKKMEVAYRYAYSKISKILIIQVKNKINEVKITFNKLL